jgi:hypothetical protein
MAIDEFTGLQPRSPQLREDFATVGAMIVNSLHARTYVTHCEYTTLYTTERRRLKSYRETSTNQLGRKKNINTKNEKSALSRQNSSSNRAQISTYTQNSAHTTHAPICHDKVQKPWPAAMSCISTSTENRVCTSLAHRFSSYRQIREPSDPFECAIFLSTTLLLLLPPKT